MAKIKGGDWMHEVVNANTRTVEVRSEKETRIAAYILLQAIQASGSVSGATEIITKPGAITIGGASPVPDRFFVRQATRELDIPLNVVDWRTNVQMITANWADQQELTIDSLGATQADVVKAMREWDQRVATERTRAKTQDAAVAGRTAVSTDAMSADEVARMLNVRPERIRLTSIHGGGRESGVMKMGPLSVIPVEAVPVNVATRDIRSGEWYGPAVTPIDSPEIELGGGVFTPTRWLVGASEADKAWRREMQEQYRGKDFWLKYGIKTWEEYYDKYDPLAQQLDSTMFPNVPTVKEMVAMFNRSMLVNVRAAVSAMMDANVARHIADLAAGRDGDLAWLVDEERIRSMIANFGAVERALSGAKTTVQTMTEYCLEATQSSDGQLVVLPLDVLATMAAAVESMFTGLEAGRVDAAVSFVRAGVTSEALLRDLGLSVNQLKRR